MARRNAITVFPDLVACSESAFQLAAHARHVAGTSRRSWRQQETDQRANCVRAHQNNHAVSSGTTNGSRHEDVRCCGKSGEPFEPSGCLACSLFMPRALVGHAAPRVSQVAMPGQPVFLTAAGSPSQATRRCNSLPATIVHKRSSRRRSVVLTWAATYEPLRSAALHFLEACKQVPGCTKTVTDEEASRDGNGAENVRSRQGCRHYCL